MIIAMFMVVTMWTLGFLLAIKNLKRDKSDELARRRAEKIKINKYRKDKLGL